MADLETFGLRFVTEGVKSATADIGQYNKSITESTKTQEKFAKSSDKTAKGGKSLSDTFKNLFGEAKKLGGQSGELVTKLTQMTGVGADIAPIFSGAVGSLGSFAGALGVATVGVTAFVALATRSAGLRGIIEGFDELAQQTGQSTNQFLANLDRAAKGTVSQTALMTQANTALAGATGAVAVELGQKLPQVLEIARAQARRTGQSTDFLFQSLVTGIKRSSPLLIDNTGGTWQRE
jgi:methyl-accepting chemotaxis protein